MQIKSHYLLFALAATIFLGINWITVSAQTNHEFIFGDLLPDAPELAKRGDFGVGVRTIDLIHKNQPDVLNHKEGVTPNYDRPLKVEVWYPALIPADQNEIEVYHQVMGNRGDTLRPLIPFTFKGRALRNAKPDRSAEAYPLVILSHGYTGSRLLFTYLAENLASKGYVVASIGHTESTFADANHFTSTLANRSLDQLFVLNEMDRLGKTKSGSFLAELVDASNTGLIGYSMGGYGALNTVGAGYSARAEGMFKNMSGGSDALNKRIAGSPEYIRSQDARFKAVVAFAPWGMNAGVWDSLGLAGLKGKILFVAGSQDDISGYENGIKAIYDGAVNADRYLLTYINARHNIAPNPPAEETMQEGLHIDEYLRYGDSVWDQRRINNINQHFVTAFLGINLKGKDYQKYLNLEENATTGNWHGFKPRTSIGLEFRHGIPKN